MENPGAVPAVYLTFEFHAGTTEATGDLVDREWYLATNPDVAAAGIDPVDHYMQFGAAEGRKPRPPVDRPRTLDEMLFDRDWYLAQNPDVATAGLDPFDHYMGFGAGEGRHPCADYHYRLIARSGLFDGDWYRRRYPDAAAFDGDPCGTIWPSTAHKAGPPGRSSTAGPTCGPTPMSARPACTHCCTISGSAGRRGDRAPFRATGIRTRTWPGGWTAIAPGQRRSTGASRSARRFSATTTR